MVVALHGVSDRLHQPIVAPRELLDGFLGEEGLLRGQTVEAKVRGVLALMAIAVSSKLVVRGKQKIQLHKATINSASISHSCRHNLSLY